MMNESMRRIVQLQLVLCCALITNLPSTARAVSSLSQPWHSDAKLLPAASSTLARSAASRSGPAGRAPALGKPLLGLGGGGWNGRLFLRGGSQGLPDEIPQAPERYPPPRGQAEAPGEEPDYLDRDVTMQNKDINLNTRVEAPAYQGEDRNLPPPAGGVRSSRMQIYPRRERAISELLSCGLFKEGDIDDECLCRLKEGNPYTVVGVIEKFLRIAPEQVRGNPSAYLMRMMRNREVRRAERFARRGTEGHWNGRPRSMYAPQEPPPPYANGPHPAIRKEPRPYPPYHSHRQRGFQYDGPREQRWERWPEPSRYGRSSNFDAPAWQDAGPPMRPYPYRPYEGAAEERMEDGSRFPGPAAGRSRGAPRSYREWVSPRNPRM
uniref:Heterogeneous nuclear ribonucleoprotein Q acidic domain-containing protein n=1 Tax=Guillardia theta TaxID=55529 RepID=A0A7S4JEG3_GUITH|mmetsp:Transcript_15700/g.52557  ORF Transcript_15700/g.52557 Transcript_15700/m.52557 type:complete len:379 (+) Transcript_15700:311-1447(+)